MRKPNKDEGLASEKRVKVGEEYTYRLFIIVPKGTAMKTLTVGARNKRRWAFDVSSLK